MIKFNQNAWLKPYININADLTKITKTDFQKDFLKLMNNAVFGKNYKENVRKHRLSHYKIFHRKCFSNRNEKTEILMNKPSYLGFSIL